MSRLLRPRTALLIIGIVIAVVVPSFLKFDAQGLATGAVITGLMALSLVVLMGFVGQVSFAQYSFAALGAMTVGSLVSNHGVNFWVAMTLGTAFATGAGVLLGIPALRLRGLLLAILTLGFALFVDNFVLAPGIWDGFSGGANGWSLVSSGFPSIFGRQLDYYTFYLFTLGVLLLAVLLVWNLRTAKTGRVLRGIRDSEIAARTLGLNVAVWKLAAFGLSAGLAGLAGTLFAVNDMAVSGGPASAYNFQFSIQLVAALTVFGAGFISSAPLVGIFVIFAPWALDRTPLSHQWFPFILGAILIVQLVTVPDGVVAKTRRDIAQAVARFSNRRRAAPTVVGVS